MELKRRSFLKTAGASLFAFLFLKNNGKPSPIPEIKPEEYHETYQEKSIKTTVDWNNSGQFLGSGYICITPVSGSYRPYENVIVQIPKKS